MSFLIFMLEVFRNDMQGELTLQGLYSLHFKTLEKVMLLAELLTEYRQCD